MHRKLSVHSGGCVQKTLNCIHFELDGSDFVGLTPSVYLTQFLGVFCLIVKLLYVEILLFVKKTEFLK